MTLTEFYSFKFSSLRVLRESSFKAPKVMFNEYLTIEMFIFAYFIQKVTLSDHGLRTWRDTLLIFMI